MTIEKAYNGERMIGYRLTEGDHRLLVWADQSVLAGFRVGDHFVPSIDEEIRYIPCQLIETIPAPFAEAPR